MWSPTTLQYDSASHLQHPQSLGLIFFGLDSMLFGGWNWQFKATFGGKGCCNQRHRLREVRCALSNGGVLVPHNTHGTLLSRRVPPPKMAPKESKHFGHKNCINTK